MLRRATSTAPRTAEFAIDGAIRDSGAGLIERPTASRAAMQQGLSRPGNAASGEFVLFPPVGEKTSSRRDCECARANPPHVRRGPENELPLPQTLVPSPRQPATAKRACARDPWPARSLALPYRQPSAARQ